MLKQTFRPEFINRIDDIIIFESLKRENIKEIASLVLKDIENRLKEQNISLKLTEKAIDWIVNNGFDENYGARPLKRLLKRELENKLAYALLEGKIKQNQEVIIGCDDTGLTLSN